MITVSPQELSSRPVETYDQVAGLGVAEHAIAAYLVGEKYRLHAARAGYHKAQVASAGPAQYAVASSPEAIVVSIVGTNQVSDWFYNLASGVRVRWAQCMPKHCKIGLGWYLQSRRMLGDIVESISWAQVGFPEAKVYIGGHSQGGADCPGLVCAIDEILSASPGNLWRGFEACFMAEPARPGNASFEVYYDNKYTYGRTPTYTIINASRGVVDIVPRAWPKRCGNRHVGHLALYADGHLINSWEAWQSYRDENPVGHLKAWQIVSRATHAVRAHLGEQLLESMRSGVK